MPSQKLTQRLLNSLAPTREEYFIWDTDVRGFGVRVQPTGRRVFVFKCRPAGGRASVQRKITIGEFRRITVNQARAEAKRLAGEVAAGRDPGASRDERRRAHRAARDAATVAALGIEFLDHVCARCTRSTAYEWSRLWRRHIGPALGSKRVAEVNTAQIAALARSLRETPTTANRVVSLIKLFFNFAAKHGVVPPHTNPAVGVERYRESARERFLTAEEYGRLGNALMTASTHGLPPSRTDRRYPKRPETAKHRPKSIAPTPANPYAVAAIKLALLSGMREGEVLTLRWNAVDFDLGFITLNTSKTGKSVRPLSAAAAAVLTDLPRLEGNPYCFPGAREGAHLREIGRVWRAVRHSANLDDVRMHDLRHSAASVSALAGDTLLVTSKLLGHVTTRMTERYAHLAQDPIKRAADRMGAGISAWLTGSFSPSGQGA